MPSLAARYTRDAVALIGKPVLEALEACKSLDAARNALFALTAQRQLDAAESTDTGTSLHLITVIRDCARRLRSMASARADALAGFSVTQTVWDLARGRPRPDLQPGFYADLTHLLSGFLGHPLGWNPPPADPAGARQGRAAAIARSDDLDQLWARHEQTMSRYPDGLTEEAVARRLARQQRIRSVLGASEADWQDWSWHVGHIVTDPDLLSRLVTLTPAEHAAIRDAVAAHLPFGITPYYLTLLDDDEAGRDRAVRAQVLPPSDYVRYMAEHRTERSDWCDFMLERDTSPIDLITRRYPGIVILKPFNTCPQICVYCQRNWEIEQAMAPGALAAWDKIEEACGWIEERPAITEVLVTGGDPLAMTDDEIERILARLARIPTIDMIRIGSRILVTMPMRITERLAATLGRYREPGRREICVVTHVEHPYEVTPEMVRAADRLRRQGLAIYNQLVYTFFVSRRFEATRLRVLLRRCGIDPYYTFAPKGKYETAAYRVPIARLVQEQKEEARLVPGTRRTDERVFNLPGLGKNYLRSLQHRDPISLLPDGSRVDEFHPWEKNIMQRDGYVGVDVPILPYLERLAAIGEDPGDYQSIWYYF